MKTNSVEIPLFDLYGLWYKPLWHTTLFWWLVGGLLVVGTVISIFFIIRVLRRRSIQKEPWQEALEQLYALCVKDYENPSRHAVFYSDLTYILKKYLRYRYELDLESKTDQEVVILLRESALFEEFLDELSEILHGALSIKFAHQYAAYQRMHNDLKRSIEIMSALDKKQKINQKSVSA